MPVTGALPRGVGCERGSTHFQVAPERDGPPIPDHLVRTSE